MGVKSGLGSAIGVAVEVTPGVPVAPAVWSPFVSEGLGQEIERMESDDIIADARFLDTTQWDQGGITVGGDLAFEWKNRQMGKWFAGMIGLPVTTGAGPYTHTYSPGDLPSLTIQKLLVGNQGTKVPLTYSGCKIASWEIACTAGQFATLGLTVAGMHEIGYRSVADMVTNSTTTITSATAAFTENDIGKPVSGTNISAGAVIASINSATSAVISIAATGTGSSGTLNLGTAAGTPSFTASRSFAFQRGSVSLAGAAAARVKSATVSGDNGLDAERLFIGQQWHDEALEGDDRRTVDGSLELEFADLAHYDRYRRAAEMALVLAFRSGTDTATMTMNVRLDGETPKVGGRGVITQNLPFKAVRSSGDSSALQVVLVNGDSAY
jgi:hypothetical protein